MQETTESPLYNSPEETFREAEWHLDPAIIVSAADAQLYWRGDWYLRALETPSKTIEAELLSNWSDLHISSVHVPTLGEFRLGLDFGGGKAISISSPDEVLCGWLADTPLGRMHVWGYVDRNNLQPCIVAEMQDPDVKMLFGRLGWRKSLSQTEEQVTIHGHDDK